MVNGVGPNLQALLHGAGFGNIEVSGFVIRYPTVNELLQIFQLEQFAAEKISHGHVDKEPGSAWLPKLLDEGKSGRFFSSITLFIGYGEKAASTQSR